MPFSKLITTLFACLTLALFASSAQAFAPFQMGIHDPGATEGAELPAQRVSAANASISRTTTLWSSIAPNGPTKPSGFDARNPADPKYNWTALDAFVNGAAAHDVAPLVTTYGTPDWAEGNNDADRAKRFGDPGTYHPNAKEYGDFMFALATRYSGKFTPSGASVPLPRVKYFQVWNEENFGQYLTSKNKTEIPVYYAKLLNAGYDSVKKVSKSNVVVGGGLGPFGQNGHATDVEPQVFIRELFCLSGKDGKNLKKLAKCSVPTPKFDIWAQHPYTFGGTPTTKGQAADTGAIGNMPAVVRTLKFAVKANTVAPRGNKKIWVTEFAWFSDPPGLMSGQGAQLGVPPATQAAYLSETAFRLWHEGFSALVWYSLEDLNGFPSGLYSGTGDAATPKPALNAFRFPFYADYAGGKVQFWGLVSRGGKTNVRIERQVGSKFKRVADLKSDSQGMIYTRLSASKGTYRATALDGAKKGLVSETYKAR
jgi:hypothetical protein